IHVTDAIILLDPGLDHDITLIIDDHVEFFGGQPQQISDFIGQGTEIPDMCHRHHQVDVSHAFAAHLFLSHFHPATVAHDSLITNPFVFTTMTFIILYRTKNAL